MRHDARFFGGQGTDRRNEPRPQTPVNGGFHHVHAPFVRVHLDPEPF
ncbi:hypothetical protein ACFL53_00420 [Pseudomonadota bacterium]